MKTLDEHSVEWPVRTGRDARELLYTGASGNAGTGGRMTGERRTLPLCSSSSILYIAGAPG